MPHKIFYFRINTYILIIVATSLLIFFHYLGILRPIENLIIILVRPIEKVIYRSGILINNPENNLTKEELIQENKKLKDQISSALIENARLHSLIIKSEVLQKELAFLEAKGFKAKTAQIIGKIPNSTAQLYLLDKGKVDNIISGLPVIYLNGILVGKIIKVEDFTSQMLLINDSNSKIAAQVLNEKNTPGLVVGKLGLALEMQLIPQEEEIAVNQMVITSGLEESIPQGLTIGQIGDINRKTEELFQTATIKSPISLDRLNIVSIIIP